MTVSTRICDMEGVRVLQVFDRARKKGLLLFAHRFANGKDLRAYLVRVPREEPGIDFIMPPAQFCVFVGALVADGCHTWDLFGDLARHFKEQPEKAERLLDQYYRYATEPWYRLVGGGGPFP